MTSFLSYRRSVPLAGVLGLLIAAGTVDRAAARPALVRST